MLAQIRNLRRLKGNLSGTVKGITRQQSITSILLLIPGRYYKQQSDQLMFHGGQYCDIQKKIIAPILQKPQTITYSKQKQVMRYNVELAGKWIDWVTYHIFCCSIFMIYRHSMLSGLYHHALTSFKCNRYALKFNAEIQTVTWSQQTELITIL